MTESTRPANGTNEARAGVLDEAASEAQTAEKTLASQPAPQAELDPLKDLLAMEQQIRAQKMALVAQQKPEALSRLQEAILQTLCLEDDFKSAQREWAVASELLKTAEKNRLAARDKFVTNNAQLTRRAQVFIELGILTEEEVRNLGVNLPLTVVLAPPELAKSARGRGRVTPEEIGICVDDLNRKFRGDRGDDKSAQLGKQRGQRWGSNDLNTVKKTLLAPDGLRRLTDDEEAGARWCALASNCQSSDEPRLCLWGKQEDELVLTLACQRHADAAHQVVLQELNPAGGQDKFVFSFLECTNQNLKMVRDMLAVIGQLDRDELQDFKDKVWDKLSLFDNKKLTPEEWREKALYRVKLCAVKHALYRAACRKGRQGRRERPK